MTWADHRDHEPRGGLPAPATYSLRPLRPDDLDAISRVHWRACRVAYRFMSWSYTEDQVRCWYAHKLQEWDWARVGCLGDAVIAYLAALGAHVDQLFVDPDHQRAGLGSALLGAMLDRGLRPVTLTVFAENAPARALYERFGFRAAAVWWDEQDQAVNLRYRLE